MLKHNYLGLVLQFRYLFPTRIGQRGRVGHENQHAKYIGLGEVRRKEESFTTLQSGHLLYHSEANNGQAGVGFLINKKWKDNITRVSSGSSRVAELILRITDRYQLKIVQV